MNFFQIYILLLSSPLLSFAIDTKRLILKLVFDFSLLNIVEKEKMQTTLCFLIFLFKDKNNVKI